MLTDEEAAKLVNEEELKLTALENAEQNGIVFIDEIDKVAKRGETSGTDVSREGVQRDLLPLVEGCTVSTKAGMIKTDHILFIASGAFHVAKPSDHVRGFETDRFQQSLHHRVQAARTDIFLLFIDLESNLGDACKAIVGKRQADVLGVHQCRVLLGQGGVGVRAGCE